MSGRRGVGGAGRGVQVRRCGPGPPPDFSLQSRFLPLILTIMLILMFFIIAVLNFGAKLCGIRPYELRDGDAQSAVGVDGC